MKLSSRCPNPSMVMPSGYPGASMTGSSDGQPDQYARSHQPQSPHAAIRRENAGVIDAIGDAELDEIEHRAGRALNVAAAPWRPLPETRHGIGGSAASLRGLRLISERLGGAMTTVRCMVHTLALAAALIVMAGGDVLGGPEEIDWALLNHAYGSASDVPCAAAGTAFGIIPRTHAGPARAVRERLPPGHQVRGDGHAVPFLARLAADGQTPHRDQIVHLLAALAIGYDETFLPAGYTSLGGEPRSIGCAWRILTSRDATLKPGLTRPGVRPNGGSAACTWRSMIRVTRCGPR